MTHSPCPLSRHFDCSLRAAGSKRRCITKSIARKFFAANTEPFRTFSSWKGYSFSFTRMWLVVVHLHLPLGPQVVFPVDHQEAPSRSVADHHPRDPSRVELGLRILALALGADVENLRPEGHDLHWLVARSTSHNHLNHLLL